MYSRVFSALLLLLFFLGAARAEDTESPYPLARTHGPSPEVSCFQSSLKVELYRLRIVNDSNGLISGSRDGGMTWLTLGHVTAYTHQVSDEGYTASKWAPLECRGGHRGEMRFTFVRATTPVTISWVVFSPSCRGGESTRRWGASCNPSYSPDASITSTSPAARRSSAARWSPDPGQSHPLFDPSRVADRLRLNYVPNQGDVLRSPPCPSRSIAEGLSFSKIAPGGFITVEDWKGYTEAIGEVLKPAQGVGRFHRHAITAWAACARIITAHRRVRLCH